MDFGYLYSKFCPAVSYVFLKCTYLVRDLKQKSQVSVAMYYLVKVLIL